jgi:hypothetical protein
MAFHGLRDKFDTYRYRRSVWTHAAIAVSQDFDDKSEQSLVPLLVPHYLL